MDIQKIISLVIPLIPKFFLMFLRGMSIVSKFLLLIVMGRYLSLADIGIYGLILGAGVIYTQAAGWGFGFHLNRHMVTAGLPEAQTIFARQWGVFFYTYLATIVLSAPFFLPEASGYTHMDSVTTALALFIILGEHISFELSRLLITTKRAMKGNILLFLRTAGWAFPVVGLMLLSPAARSLDAVLGAWCVSNVLAFILGMWWCREYINRPWPFVKNSLLIPCEWLRAHIGPSITVYIAFLANAVLMFVNRYTVGGLLGMEETGLYTLYWSVVNAIYVLAQTGFIQTAYPAMIEVREDAGEFWQKTISLYKQTVFFAIITGICISVIAPWLFVLMNKAEATDNLPFFYALMCAGIARLISVVSFYVLYARHNDKELMKGMLATLALGIPFSIISVMTFGLWGSALSEGFSALAMFAILAWTYRKVSA